MLHHLVNIWMRLPRYLVEYPALALVRAPLLDLFDTSRAVEILARRALLRILSQVKAYHAHELLGQIAFRYNTVGPAQLLT
jgi:hypothetical protein